MCCPKWHKLLDTEGAPIVEPPVGRQIAILTVDNFFDCVYMDKYGDFHGALPESHNEFYPHDMVAEWMDEGPDDGNYAN